MGNKTGINWTNRTQNPLRVKDSRTFYCVKVSPACASCYAEKMAKRLAGMGGTKFYPYKHMENPPALELNRKMLESWKRTKKPYMNFVTSMTDLFGEFVPREWIFEILDAMVGAPNQIFQCLTKRAERMRELVSEYCFMRRIDVLPSNIWMGVTVESQKYYDERIQPLANTPLSVRWLSIEPMLGPIELDCAENYGWPKLDWIVVGGETAPKDRCRPAHPDWFRSLRKQCEAYNIPFFFKQWGNYYPCELSKEKPTTKVVYALRGDNSDMPRFRSIEEDFISDLVTPAGEVQYMKYMPKKHAGELLDGVAYRQFPAIDHPAIPEE